MFTIRDLPVWLIRVSPWLWLVVMSLGLLVIAWALIRRRGKFPACPKCGYDLRGTEGLTCPECGHTAQSPRQLFGRPRRWRWAVTGLLIVLAGVQVDFVQYRMWTGERFLSACVPTTVWIAGYPWWPDSGRRMIERRLQRGWAVLPGNAVVWMDRPRPTGYLRDWLLGLHDADHLRQPFACRWQSRLLARRAYTWFLSHQRSGNLTPNDYRYTFWYLKMSVLMTEDDKSYQQIVNGLTSADPYMRANAYSSLRGTEVVTAKYVPVLEKLLVDELCSPSPPVPFGNWVMPQPYPGRLLPPHCDQLIQAIGQSGSSGIAVASEWLTHEPMNHRLAAVHMLGCAKMPVAYTPEMAQRLVDAIVTLPWDGWSSEQARDAGTLVVEPVTPYLSAFAPVVRENAVRVLGAAFFHWPLWFHYQGEASERIIEQWAARVNDPMFEKAVQQVRARLEVEEELGVRVLLQRFLDYAETWGDADGREHILHHHGVTSSAESNPFND